MPGPALQRGLHLLSPLLGLLLPAVAGASPDRTLEDYRFIPLSTVGEPFVTTHFANSTGIATASNVEIPVILETTPPDTLFSVGGNVMFITLDFTYQHALTPRLAARVKGGGVSRIGTSGQSILSQGVSALTDFEVGVLYETWRSDDKLVSVFGDLEWGKTLRVDLVQFAEDVISGGIRNASVLFAESAMTYTGGVRFAWATSRWTGISAEGVLGGTTVDREDESVLWRVAASHSWDFHQKGSRPVGLALSVALDQQRTLGIGSDTAVDVGLGVFYTGREDLNLGAELNWVRLPQVTEDIVIYPFGFALALRYYF